MLLGSFGTALTADFTVKFWSSFFSYFFAAFSSYFLVKFSTVCFGRFLPASLSSFGYGHFAFSLLSFTSTQKTIHLRFSFQKLVSKIVEPKYRS